MRHHTSVPTVILKLDLSRIHNYHTMRLNMTPTALKSSRLPNCMKVWVRKQLRTTCPRCPAMKSFFGHINTAVCSPKLLKSPKQRSFIMETPHWEHTMSTVSLTIMKVCLALSQT